MASEALEPAYREVQQAVEQRDHANVDKTSQREGRRKLWLWTAVTAVATLFCIHGSRGKGLAAVLGDLFSGLVTSDRL